jgi:hypothetical protein
MAAPVGATTRCARRIPPDACAPDKFSNLSHDAAAPPRVRRTAQRQLAGGDVPRADGSRVRNRPPRLDAVEQHPEATLSRAGARIHPPAPPPTAWENGGSAVLQVGPQPRYRLPPKTLLSTFSLLLSRPQAAHPPAKQRPVNRARVTAGGGWGEGEMAAPVGATTRCARRIPPDACAPDKFSNLSHDAAAPPPVQANGPASAGWWRRATRARLASKKSPHAARPG